MTRAASRLWLWCLVAGLPLAMVYLWLPTADDLALRLAHQAHDRRYA